MPNFKDYLFMFEEYEPMEFPFGSTAKALQKESDSAGYDKSKFASRAAAEANSLGLKHISFGRYADKANPHKVVAYSIKDGDDYRLVKVKDQDFDQSFADRDPTDQEKADLIGAHGPSTDEPEQEERVQMPDAAQWEQFAKNPEDFKQFFAKVLKQFDPDSPENTERLNYVPKNKDDKKKRLFPVGGKTWERGLIGIYADGAQRQVGNIIMIDGKPKTLSGKYPSGADLAPLATIANDMAKAHTEALRAQSAGAQTKTQSTASTAQAVAPVASEPDATMAARIQYKRDSAASANNFNARLDTDTFRSQPTAVRKYVQQAAVEINTFMDNPTPEAARALVQRYNIRTNSVDKNLILGDVGQYIKRTGDDRKDAMAIKDARELLNSKSEIHGKGSRSASASEFLMRTLRDTLGPEEYENLVKVDGGIKTMIRPDFIFDGASRAPEIMVDAVSTQIDGKTYSKVFTQVDKKELHKALLEAKLRMESYHARNVRNLLGPTADPAKETVSAETKAEAERAVRIYERRNYTVELLEKLSESHVADLNKFEGKTQAHKIANATLRGLSRAANRAGAQLGPQEVQVAKLISELADMQADTYGEGFHDAYDAHWMRIREAASQSEHLKDSLPEICEVLTAMRLALEGCDVYIPTSRNFEMIDAVGVKEIAPISKVTDVETFIDTINLVHTSTDLRSVKRREGAAPSIKSIRKYVKFDESVFTVKPMDAGNDEESSEDGDAPKKKRGPMEAVIPTIPDDVLDLNFIMHGARDILKNDAWVEHIPAITKRVAEFMNHPKHKKAIRKYFHQDPNTPADQLFKLLSTGSRFDKVEDGKGGFRLDPGAKSKVFNHDVITKSKMGRQRGELVSVFGFLTEYALNVHTHAQGFLNESYYDDGVDRTDGIDTIAKFVFEGVQVDTRKASILPFGFKLMSMSQEEARDGASVGKTFKKSARARVIAKNAAARAQGNMAPARKR